MALIIDSPQGAVTKLDVAEVGDVQFNFSLDQVMFKVDGNSLVIVLDGKTVVLENFYTEAGEPAVQNFVFVTGEEVTADLFSEMVSRQADTDMETAANQSAQGSGSGVYQDGHGTLLGGVTNMFNPAPSTPPAPDEGDGGGSGTPDPLVDASFYSGEGDGTDTVVPGVDLHYTADSSWGMYFAVNQGSAGVDATGDRTFIFGKNETHESYTGGDGTDTLTLTDGNDVLMLENDGVLPSGHLGVEGIEVIHAGAGNDVIDLTGSEHTYGDVTVYGEDGVDIIWGNAGNDLLNGGAGNDSLVGGLGNDTIYGEDGSDKIKGGQGDDALYGGTGSDTVYGGSGSDHIDLGAGNDRVNAGTGDHDQITLGDGADTVVINQSSLTGDWDGSLVSVLDFHAGEDVLDLSGLKVLDVETGSDYTALFVADDTDATNSTWVMLHGVDNSDLASIVDAGSYAHATTSVPDASEYLQQHLANTDFS